MINLFDVQLAVFDLKESYSAFFSSAAFFCLSSERATSGGM
jgi:hypothetical protein